MQQNRETRVGRGRVMYDSKHQRWFVDIFSPPSRRSFKTLSRSMEYVGGLGYKSAPAGPEETEFAIWYTGADTIRKPPPVQRTPSLVSTIFRKSTSSS